MFKSSKVTYEIQENVPTVLSSTSRRFQKDKLTRNQVSKTRGYKAGTEYVRSGSNRKEVQFVYFE